MTRRWSIPLTTAALVLGSLMALGGTASAAPAHPAAGQAGPGAAVPGFQPGGPMARPSAAGASAVTAQGRGGRTTDESTNWSGYAATGANGAFTSISASWKEPTATCSSRSAQYASFWVGLDGFTSDSVEQTGTDSDCSGRTPHYYGWYEMFPANPVNFTNPVSPGDSFTASVTFSGTQTYTLVLKDTTRGWTQTITKNQSGLDRSSAEVITEAPSSQSGVLPLANFGTVSYSASAANGTSLASQSPTEIIMIDNSNRDKDSTSAIGSGGAFSNTWIRAN
ncbi:MAG TPA: G1 family glutamic endopeptidase [Streptosporangiaceae bacterium]|nr:G1 family glutamic endopeptidase [Streptosporangiaceae bacterium]